MSTRKVSGAAGGLDKSKLKPQSTHSPTSSLTSLKGGSKLKNTPKPIQESDIDTDNLPVIQGSFEITKTDADISQKRASNARPSSTASLQSSTLKPFYISPASSIKIKSSVSGQQTTSSSTTAPKKLTSTTDSTTTVNIVEMFLQQQKQHLQKQQNTKDSPVTAKIEKTNKSGETTTTIKAGIVEFVTESTTLQTTTNGPTLHHDDYNVASQINNNKELPKLDVSLFTSAPILDNEPWRPINPSPEQVKVHTSTVVSTSESSSAVTVSTDMPYRSPFNPKPIESVVYRNKFVDPDAVYPLKDNDSDSVLYQSYYNPDFSAGSLEIEKLGMADVKPYPLPVNKIDISEEVGTEQQTDDGKKKPTIDPSNVNYDEDKFEHLGGGVIAKKNDNTTSSTVQPTININDAQAKNDTAATTDTSLDDIFQELLDNNVTLNKTQDDVLESRIVPDDEDDNDESYDDDVQQSTGEDDKISATTQKLSFLNMKNFIMQMKQNKSSDGDSDESTTVSMTFDITTATAAVNDGGLATTLKPTTTFVEVDTVKYTPQSSVKSTTSRTTSPIAEPQLFPSISKWEFVNGTRTNLTEMSLTKKVFNETLQAVIVENAQTTSHTVPPSQLDDLKANHTIDKGNLQQLSSIFDTLAAKLGIKPDVASKVPPFSQHTQNKIKQNVGNNNNQLRTTTITSSRKNSGSTTRQYVTRTTTKTPKKSTTTTRRRTTVTNSPIEPTRSFEYSSESLLGQAEVEAVDPTQYEEILSMASSPISRKFISTTPSLVTLMPVKSNSGIRNFNPRLKLPSNTQTSSETRNLETVVKASMSFDS